MKLLIQSAMIFLGTLMAAGVVALGEPAKAGGTAASSVPHANVTALHRDTADAHADRGIAMASSKAGALLH